MSYTDIGQASVAHYDSSWNPTDRKWTCTCGDCKLESLVGTWTCPSFYDETITISKDFANGFTDARNNDYVDVCVKKGTP